LDLRPNPTFVGTLTLHYVIHTVNGDSNTATVTVQVTAVPAPTCTLSANPAAITIGQSSTLQWTTANNPTSASIDNGVGPVNPADGATGVKVSPTGKYEVHLTVHQCGRQWDVLSERDCESPNADFRVRASCSSGLVWSGQLWETAYTRLAEE